MMGEVEVVFERDDGNSETVILSDEKETFTVAEGGETITVDARLDPHEQKPSVFPPPEAEQEDDRVICSYCHDPCVVSDMHVVIDTPTGVGQSEIIGYHRRYVCSPECHSELVLRGIQKMDAEVLGEEDE